MAETVDLLVIGGGVFGLETALAAADRGLRVVVVEAGRIGAGASGGLVGALAPHRPGRWRGFERFQFEALRALPDRMADLATRSGVDPGYARTGRMTPLTTAAERTRAEEQCAHAATLWRGAGRFEVVDTPPPGLARWLPPASCAHGAICEALSARVAPRRYLAALAAALAGRAEIREGWRCVGLHPAGVARFGQGEIAAGAVALAAGCGSWSFVADLVGQPWGGAVKGQAALLAADAPPDLPLIQAAGLWVVGHSDGHVAVGSTSETAWEVTGPDGRLDSLLCRARQLIPALADARVVERWAGFRPKGPRSLPLVGRVPGAERLIIATGGYRTGLGVAHRIGASVAAMAAGGSAGVDLPPEFAPKLQFRDVHAS